MSEGNVNEVVETTVVEEVSKGGLLNFCKSHKKGLIIGTVAAAAVAIGAGIVRAIRNADVDGCDEYVDSYDEEVVEDNVTTE